MHTLSIEHVHTYQTYSSANAHSQLSMCTGYKNKRFMFVFVTQKCVFVTQIIVFVTQKKNSFCNPKKKKIGLQKGTGYKKEHFWVTKKNVTKATAATTQFSFLCKEATKATTASSPFLQAMHMAREKNLEEN